MPPFTSRRSDFAVKLVIVGAAGVLAAACRHAQPSVAPKPEEGIYEFSAYVGRETLNGTLLVMRDTIVVRAESAECIPEHAGKDLQVLNYFCNGTPTARLALNRRRPASQSRWHAASIQRRVRTVCVEYAINERGRVCVRSRSEHYEASTPISGLLKTRRVAPTPTESPSRHEPS